MSRQGGRDGRTVVTAKNVDLSNCDRELVQFPGAIQAHGAMLIVDEPDLIIRQASANCEHVIGRSRVISSASAYPTCSITLPRCSSRCIACRSRTGPCMWFASRSPVPPTG